MRGWALCVYARETRLLADTSLHGLMVSGPCDDGCSHSAEARKETRWEGKRESHRRRNGETAKVSEPMDPFPITLSAFAVVPRPSESQRATTALLFHPRDQVAPPGLLQEMDVL